MWALYEQVLVASLDVGDTETAKKCLIKLNVQFPGSSRVKRAEGMILESTGEFEGALKIYDEILEKNPTNLLILRRKVCVHKAKGDISLTISALNSILEINASDVSIWIELSEIYLSISNYEVLHDSHNINKYN